jgi:hypothetical protein
MRQLMACAAVAGVLAGAAGCSSTVPRPGGPRVVLAVQTGITDGYTIRLGINDEGVPPLNNLTGYPVRLLPVQWVHKPAAAHIVNVYAYTYAAVEHRIISAVHAARPRRCRWPGRRTGCWT